MDVKYQKLPQCENDMETQEVMQEIIDELRGELDRKHSQEPGWSGPITAAYMRGYGRHPRHAEFVEAATYREATENMGGTPEKNTYLEEPTVRLS